MFGSTKTTTFDCCLGTLKHFVVGGNPLTSSRTTSPGRARKRLERASPGALDMGQSAALSEKLAVAVIVARHVQDRALDIGWLHALGQFELELDLLAPEKTRVTLIDFCQHVDV